MRRGCSVLFMPLPTANRAPPLPLAHAARASRRVRRRIRHVLRVHSRHNRISSGGTRDDTLDAQADPRPPLTPGEPNEVTILQPHLLDPVRDVLHV